MAKRKNTEKRQKYVVKTKAQMGTAELTTGQTFMPGAMVLIGDPDEDGVATSEVEIVDLDRFVEGAVRRVVEAQYNDVIDFQAPERDHYDGELLDFFRRMRAAVGATGNDCVRIAGEVEEALRLTRHATPVKGGEALNLWSTHSFKQGAALDNSSFQLFSTPKGQCGQGSYDCLTISETNLREGGRIQGGYAYFVHSITIEVLPANNFNEADRKDVIANFAEHGVLAWDFLNTRIEIGALGSSKVGDGLFRMNLATPQCLPANTTFAMLLQMGRDAKPMQLDTKVRINLHGTTRKPLPSITSTTLPARWAYMCSTT